MFLRSCLAFCAVFALAPLAHAGTVSYGFSGTGAATITGGGTGASFTITGVTEFDPSLGTLNSITINVGNPGITDAAAIVAFKTRDSGNNAFVAGLDYGNGNAVPGSALGGNYGTFSAQIAFVFAGSADTDPTNLAYMEGTGTQDITLFFTGFNIKTLTMNDGSGTVTYDYTAGPPPTVTPEPGSFALLGTGLLGVVGAVRRRLKVV